MRIRGKGIKKSITSLAVICIKKIFPTGLFYNTPVRSADILQLIKEGKGKIQIVKLFPGESHQESPPEIFNHAVSNRFSKYYSRIIPDAFIVILKNGRVYGQETNMIMSSEGVLSSDLSREFGAEGGKDIRDSDLIKHKCWFPPIGKIDGKLAVIGTKGSANFHHWNYDILPRLYLIKEMGLFNDIKYFLIPHQQLPFQIESLKLMGLTHNRIMNTYGSDKYITADELIVPSLPSVLGTVSPWVVTFLRSLYLSEKEKQKSDLKIFISRKKVKTRHIINHSGFITLLEKYGIKEVFPEDYTVSEFSDIVSKSKFIISVHGSGLSNTCFINKGTVVVDLLAPYHQDGYYWLISNICAGRYIGFFADGEHPSDAVDLVKKKKDDDLTLDLVKLEELFKRELEKI